MMISLSKHLRVLFFGAVMACLAACSPKLFPAGTEKKLYPISADQTLDQKIMDFYRPYKMKIDSQMNEVIAFSDVEIVKARPEGLLNNFFADAMFQVGKEKNIAFDMAYTNYGGLRIPIPQGPVVLSTVFELMPFENQLTTVTFSGADMQSFFDYIAAMGGDPVSGASFTIRNKKAVNIQINGKPFDTGRSYTVLTSDYMANGGDGGDIFMRATNRKEYDTKLRDALILYIKAHSQAGKHLNPRKDGRITVE